MAKKRRLGRYTVGARIYDVVSLERPVYRVGRLRGIALLGLRRGDRVLDVGCGTGLNFAPLVAAVGPTGSIVGVDRSEQMLERAHARVRRAGWHHIDLVQADAGTVPSSEILAPASYDAVLFTYSLSVIANSPAAWTWALSMLRPGRRVVVVDLDMPSGAWALLRPLAWLACRSGGARYRCRVWDWVARDTQAGGGAAFRGGHIRVAAGTRAPAGSAGRCVRGGEPTP